MNNYFVDSVTFIVMKICHEAERTNCPAANESESLPVISPVSDFVSRLLFSIGLCGSSASKG